MIQKNQNIIFDKKINRIVEYNPDYQQITLPDQRYYKRGENLFYPSVTYILNYLPKNKFFESWLKDVGHNADVIMRKAGDEGTQVHNAAEALIAGNEISWFDENGNAKYNTEVWRMIIKFHNFWTTHKPEVIVSEYSIFSDKHKYAGTIDLVVRMNDKIWLLDIKTSNTLHRSHDLQLSTYACAWNETHDTPIDNTGIIWLKAATRGPDKQGKKIQGEGWQLKQPENHYTDDFNMFLNVYSLFKDDHPELKPDTEILPTKLKI
jgi:hypothetical protein